jgi:hypothetical protein
MQRSKAGPGPTIQRSLHEARAAAFTGLYGSGKGASAPTREAFAAAYASWDSLKTLEPRFAPREWSRIRFLNDKDRAVPAPPPAPAGPAGPGRRAPSPAELEQVRKRGQIAHVMRDVGPLMREFQLEIELQKRFNPSEILANQMTLVAGGVAKILLGSIQLATAGLSAPITGALIGGVDLATSSARSGLGLDAQSGGEARAVSATKTLMITSATKVIGPVAPFSIGASYHAASAIPVVGGAGAIALGAKDVWDGLKGIQLSAADIEFMGQSLLAIADMKEKINDKAGEMARIPELAPVAARWRACAAALDVVASDLRKLLAKKKPSSSSPKVEEVDAWSAPMTRERGRTVYGAPAPPPAPEPLVMLP